jgi:hypothetical protein
MLAGWISPNLEMAELLNPIVERGPSASFLASAILFVLRDPMIKPTS